MHWFERASELFESRDVNRAEVGRRLGITGQAVTLKLQGKRPTNVPEAKVFAEYAGVSVSEMLGDEAHLILAADEAELLELYRLLTDEQKPRYLQNLRDVVGNNAPGKDQA